MSKVTRTTRGANGSPAPVIAIAARRADRAEARAQRALNQLVQEAIAALETVLAGDTDAIHDAFWAVSRAVGMVLRHRLGTGWLSDRAGDAQRRGPRASATVGAPWRPSEVAAVTSPAATCLPVPGP